MKTLSHNQFINTAYEFIFLPSGAVSKNLFTNFFIVTVQNSNKVMFLVVAYMYIKAKSTV